MFFHPGFRILLHSLAATNLLVKQHARHPALERGQSGLQGLSGTTVGGQCLGSYPRGGGRNGPSGTKPSRSYNPQYCPLPNLTNLVLINPISAARPHARLAESWGRIVVLTK